MSSSYTKTRIMVECALMIALGTILANIKIYELPNGGSITLFSMVPFILVSFRHGVKWGLFTGFVNSLLQMLLGFYAPPAPGLLPLVGIILLDYVLAFSFLGLACVFAKPFKNKLVGVAVGSAAVCAAFPVQLFVRRADLGQPERWSARVDLQPDLQRLLHAAGRYYDHHCRGAAVQGCAPAVQRQQLILPFSTPFAWGAVFTASQDFLFPFFLICPYLLHKSFTMADITFSAPPASRTARFLPCTSSCPFQLLTITEMRFCTVFSNVFLLQYFSKKRSLYLIFIYLFVSLKRRGHLSFFQVSVKMRYIFSNITNVAFVFSALCYFDKLYLQFI